MRRFRDRLDHAGVLHREESLRDRDVENDRHSERQDRHGERQRLAFEHPGERPAVKLDRAVQHALGREIEARALRVRMMADELGAHHRHQRQRHHRRDDDRHRKRNGELVEQAADHLAHEQERDQNGDQRNGERYDGEADLLGAAQSRFERVHAAFDIARDVLDHHDRVVDHKSGGDGQGHQRQIVEAEAEQIHHAQRADQRERHRQARNDGARNGAQEEENHHHHQHDGERQLEFHVGDRSADGDGAVREHADIDRRRQRRDDARQQRLDAVDHLDDVGARLALHIEDDRGRRVRPGAELDVLGAVGDVGDVRQPHRIAVAVGDDGVGVL